MAKQYLNWKGEMVIGCPKGEGKCWETEHLTKEQVASKLEGLAGTIAGINDVLDKSDSNNQTAVSAADYDKAEAPAFKEVEQYISWSDMQKIPNSEALYNAGRNSGTIEIRQAGKIYQVKTERQLSGSFSGSPEEIAELQEGLIYGLSDVTIATREEAVGGGQGHYDYDIVTRATGWRTMTAEEITAWKSIINLKKEHKKVEREISALQKQIQQLRKSIGW